MHREVQHNVVIMGDLLGLCPDVTKEAAVGAVDLGHVGKRRRQLQRLVGRVDAR